MTVSDQLGPPATVEAVKGITQRAWQSLVGIGIASVVLGIIVLVWPTATLFVVAILFGIYLLISGSVPDRLDLRCSAPERRGASFPSSRMPSQSCWRSSPSAIWRAPLFSSRLKNVDRERGAWTPVEAIAPRPHQLPGGVQLSTCRSRSSVTGSELLKKLGPR